MKIRDSLISKQENRPPAASQRPDPPSCRITAADSSIQDIEMGSTTDAYVQKLLMTKHFWLLDDNYLIIRERDKTNRLSRRAVVVSPQTFTSQDNYESRVTILRCSCPQAEEEHKLISKAPICFASTNKLQHFADSRREKYCIHLLAALSENFIVRGEISYRDLLIDYDNDIYNEEENGPVSFLLDLPKLIAVHDGMTWGVMGPWGVKNGLVCFLSTCKEMKNRCSHLKKYLRGKRH